VHEPQRLIAVVSDYKTRVQVDYCADDAAPDAIHYIKVDRLTGSTAGASSGSGLFNASQRLIGTLLGGSDEADENGFDYYGRFDLPYEDGIKRWLEPVVPPPPASPTTN